jgi:hypothetical protein
MQPEEIWAEYEAGINFKSGIGLYDTVNRNERFFAGDQWAGVNAPDLPKPVVNFIKRACQQRVAEVKSSPVRVSFEAIDFPAAARRGARYDAATDDDTKVLNAVFAADWERMGLDCVNLDGLEDACISGDYILYSYWDASAQTGQAPRGQIRAERVDNLNYYPGDPNSSDVQSQPYIIIARREAAAKAAAQARRFAGRAQAELIRPDSDTLYRSGDISRHELDGARNCVTLLRLSRDEKTGHILAQKVTRGAQVRPQWDTRLTRYPVAMMNWEKRRGCCHGRAEITGLVPVQRYVNQMYAMMMLSSMQSACPKPVFNQGMVKAWSTAVGAAIPVSGDIDAAAKYLACPPMPPDAYGLPEKLINRTFEMLGVTDVELGSVNPTNYSALSLTRQAALLPVTSIRTRFNAMLADFASNWLDMTLAFETLPRWHMIDGGRRAVVFDTASLRGRLWNVRTEIGPAESYSDSGSAQALGALYGAGAISARQYIERLPDGYLPMRSRLLDEMAAQDKDGAENNPKP